MLPVFQNSRLNKACVSHLVIPESDQIQIVVSKVPNRLGAQNTDISITAVNQRALRTGSGSNVRRLERTGRSPSPNRLPLSRSPSSVSSGFSSAAPCPPNMQNESDTDPEPAPEKVQEFLLQNADLLKEYVVKFIDDETLEDLLIKRFRQSDEKGALLSRWKHTVSERPQRIFPQGLTVSLGNLTANTKEGAVRWELARYISGLVQADHVILYLVDANTNMLKKYCPITKKSLSERIPILEASMMSAYVAKRGEPLRMSRLCATQRFPNGIGDDDINNTESEDLQEKSAYIFCLPVMRADGDCAGVIELRRREENGPFTLEDEQIAHSYLIWGGIAFHYADNYARLQKQKKLNDFLLTVVKSIFQDMVSMDALIKKVMKFAQKLVDADRASLFLVDNRSQELYARIFDLDTEHDIAQASEEVSPANKEIRFAIGTGIAGQVASTGKALSISDAYDDPRFNADIDKQTGYKTKSILCMPILIRSTVIGVVQMVNKNNGTEFTKDDEESFETFAVYCGLALHHAKLYDKIRRSEQKSKVAVEILSYHNTANEEEVLKLKQNGIPESVLGLDDYFLSPSSVDDERKVLYAIYQFVDLFGTQRFDIDSLHRFALTVRKNYRRVPYHNWGHGWTVANSMYCILKASNVFRPLERLALYVGSLCHDLDHRGKSNKFLADTASPLASIYTTSTMEHHHFNQTVTILQQVIVCLTRDMSQDGHNIFSQLSSDEYKQVLSSIKHCILATDLALFFPYKARLQSLISKEMYSWGVPDHRLLIQAIAMTAADLCASTKRWEDQNLTVRVIFEEFYEQGDSEKAAGRKPMAMMDRDQADQQATCQVGFLSGICIPCYEILNTLIPETGPMLEGCQANLKSWKELADEEQRRKKEEEEGIKPAEITPKPAGQDVVPPKPKATTEKSVIERPKSEYMRRPSTTPTERKVFKASYGPAPGAGSGEADAAASTTNGETPSQRVIPTITTTQSD